MYMKDSLKYLTLILEDLPCGEFYPQGTKIKIRASSVGEIESYSTVDIENLEDVEEKLTHILKNNILITDIDDNEYNYNFIKENDKEYLYFIIREMTFQKGNSLAHDVNCTNCNNNYKIYYRTTSNNKHTKSIKNKKINKKIKKYYNSVNKMFEFQINGTLYKMSPPTIGLSKKIKYFSKYNKQISIYSEIISCLLPNISTITYKEIVGITKKISDLSMDEYQILSKIVSFIDFGISELSNKCPKCGTLYTENIVIPNLVQMFSLFQVNLTVLMQNQFDFLSKEKLFPSEILNMDYWKYEEFIKMLNEKIEREKKEQKEQNKNQPNMSNMKMPNMKTPSYK